MKNQKEQKLVSAKEPSKGCGHEGKWHGNGQNIMRVNDSIMIISTAVCGVCGQPVISVNKIEIKPVDPNKIVSTAPDGQVHLPSRFSKKN